MISIIARINLFLQIVCMILRNFTLRSLWVLLGCSLLSSSLNAQGPWVILRKADLYQPVRDAPPICFQFYLADTRATQGQMAFVGNDGIAYVTPFAARQGWEVDPTAQNPYYNQPAADAAMTQYSRYGGDYYGCLYKCPVNSELLYNPESGYDCYCLPGYTWNQARTVCVRIICPPHSKLQKAPNSRYYDCYCNPGYRWNQARTECLPLVCPPNSHQEWVANINNYDCFCDQGYVWDQPRLNCIPAGNTVQPPPIISNDTPSQTEKDVMIAKIKSYGEKWVTHWCRTNWSGCAIAPTGEMQGLEHKAANATSRSYLRQIDAYLKCVDAVYMSDLTEQEYNRQREACVQRHPL